MSAKQCVDRQFLGMENPFLARDVIKHKDDTGGDDLNQPFVPTERQEYIRTKKLEGLNP